MSHTLPASSCADDGEADRNAFNAAFDDLGLRWHWDSETYRSLASIECERARVARYLEGEQSHLLRAYDAEFLTSAILAAKGRHVRTMATALPGPMPRFDRADAYSVQVGF